MKNDLTTFERNLLNTINLFNKTKYNYKHLMEWSTSKKVIEENMKTGEIMYEASGCFVAIKPDANNKQ